MRLRFSDGDTRTLFGGLLLVLVLVLLLVPLLANTGQQGRQVETVSRGGTVPSTAATRRRRAAHHIAGNRLVRLLLLEAVQHREL